MEEKRLTIQEVLEMVATNLSAISVPVGFHDQIAVPIVQAVGNIRACLGAIANQEAAAANQEPASQAWREESDK